MLLKFNAHFTNFYMNYQTKYFFLKGKLHFDVLGYTSPVHVHVILVPNKTMQGGKFENEHAPCMHGY